MPDIPVVSFPHRLIPQLPLPAAAVSIAADFPFPDTQLPYQNLLLEQSQPCRWGLLQPGCILHPPKPEGPSAEGEEDPRLECDPTLGHLVPCSALSHGEQDPDVTSLSVPCRSHGAGLGRAGAAGAEPPMGMWG